MLCYIQLAIKTCLGKCFVMNFLESYLKVMNQIAELLCINNAPGFQGAHGFIDFGP